ncbi:MAG TPA: hypothetical protein VMD53_01045 [Rhizomicrobium sp.]|nr:hypothetical protein [Rhizomicrobium sp.]
MAREISLDRIRLELARTAGFPSGSSWHGYEFVAPLAADGQIDADAWNQVKDICRVRRFWGDAPEEHGQFVHAAEGWCFRYPKGNAVEREPLFKLDRHRLTPGGSVTVTEPDGRQLPFRIVAMTPAMLAW